MPGLQAAIEDRHTAAFAQPGQQPPGAGSECARAIVIEHDLAVVVDPPGTQTLDQVLRIRQGVTSGHALDDRAAQVAFKVGEMRTGNMPLGIAALAIIDIFQGKATIQYHQRRRLQAFGQLLGSDQLRERHDSLLND
ncbi:hypothetical protein D9M71_471090 [compost metagenome]